MVKKMVVVPEKKEVIDRLKKRYEYLEKKEDVYGKEIPIKISNRVLKTAAKDVGFASTFNITLPDAAEKKDAAMKTLPSLLRCSTSVVENKYGEVAKSMDVHERMDEVEVLVQQMVEAGETKEATMAK